MNNFFNSFSKVREMIAKPGYNVYNSSWVIHCPL